MPYLTIIFSEIPPGHKDKFLASWPDFQKQLESHSGVAGVSAGQIILENGIEQSKFKILQSIAFETPQEAEAFSASDFVNDIKVRYGRRDDSKKIAKFHMGDFNSEYEAKPFIQFSTIYIKDSEKAKEAKLAWDVFVAATGKQGSGGRTIDQDPLLGLGVISWDTVEDAKAAYEKAEVISAWNKYKSLGTVHNVIVKLLD